MFSPFFLQTPYTDTNTKSVTTIGLASTPRNISLGIALDISTSMTSHIGNLRSGASRAIKELYEAKHEVDATIIPFWQYHSNRNWNYFLKSAPLQENYDYIISWINAISVRGHWPSHTNWGTACAWEVLPAIYKEMEKNEVRNPKTKK